MQARESGLLPPLYQRWMGDLLQPLPPDESNATCLDCSMCSARELRPTGQEVFFRPDTKCCTFFPDIPNFLTGMILAGAGSASAAGKALFEEQFRGKALVRPHGVYPPLAAASAFSLFMPGFGQDLSLRCPYYLAPDGLCGIWNHRNSRCSTWFCKHQRGAVGRAFWRTLKDLLAAVEQHLVIWCIHRLGVGSPAFQELFPPPGVPNLDLFQRQQNFFYRSGLPPDHISKEEADDLRRFMWGKWLGREQRFFSECAQAVTALSWKKVMEIGGEILRLHSEGVLAAHRALLDLEVPETLIPATYKAAEAAPGVLRIWGYSNYDPIDLPAEVLRALPYFDGRPTTTVLAWIAEHTDIPMSREMARRLYDFGILQKPPES